MVIDNYLNTITNKNNSLSELNTAFVKEGAFINIPKNTIVPKPIQIINFSTGSEKEVLLQPINLVVVGENSHVQIIERHQNLSKNTTLTNSVTEIFVHKRAIVDYYKIQIVLGLVLALQVMFDLRIAFLTILTVFLYMVYRYIFIERINIRLYAGCLSFIALIVSGLHAYWVIPIIMYRSHPAQEMLRTFSSIEGFRFFSFATFAQTLSLLHPNWPENLFGKVYFMKPEFLILPLLAFSSLLFS